MRSRYTNSVNNYIDVYEDIGKVPAYLRGQQNELDRYKTIDFVPISSEGKALLGSKPGALMEMRKSAGILSLANAKIMNKEAAKLNPKFDGISNADLLGSF